MGDFVEQWITSIADVDPQDWDQCVNGSGDSDPFNHRSSYISGRPFIEHSFLLGLEKTGCVGGDTGWTPQHLTLYRDHELVAVSPCYIKLNSEGEFIFDWSWADAAYRAGLPYYPKRLVASPFSPVHGPRLLCKQGLSPQEKRAAQCALIEALGGLDHGPIATGSHCLFISEEESLLFAEAGWAIRDLSLIHI